jgi:hypothetical protein
MKIAEAEAGIRQLCHVWATAVNLNDTEREDPSFAAFKAWLHRNHYSLYLDFRATAGPDYMAELWFDQEFKQTWRR